MRLGDKIFYNNFKFLIAAAALVLFCGLGLSCESDEMAMVGDIRDSSEGSQNSLEIEDLAKFAVDEHNKKENALLEFVRVVKAKEQVVAGAMHHLTLEVIEAGKKKFYEAKVWVKPWMNFKELQEFKHSDHESSASTCTPSDLGVKREGHAPGLQAVPADDPAVKDAADHALQSIQQRSNSLSPYELLEILSAKAEVIEESAKFHMLLKLKRGSKEEKYKVEVHRNEEGTHHLNQMEADLS
ncbi:hypothetical protein MKW98_026502 [Papaver atlanticum]|uniref:Cysteine proteinase inhibitor n=1 Tax=Papaver atlanticum TaxID=357466 RepID=A0AAD4TCU8_9MAGN|nr:hypothetical protein MKW98_026502 [Papaver atlanticum]